MNIEDMLSDGIILSTSLLANWYGNYRTYITFDNRYSWVILEDKNGLRLVEVNTEVENGSKAK